MVLRAELLLLLLAGAAVAWDPTPHYEMVACHGGSTDDKPCQFYPGTKVWAARRSPLAARCSPLPARRDNDEREISRSAITRSDGFLAARASAAAAAARARAAWCARAGANPWLRYAHAQTVWDPDAEAYEEDSDGSYGAPYHDSVDTEWSKKWVDQQTPMVREAIINGNFRIGRDTTGTKGEAGANLMLPLPGNPEYPEPFNPETYQKLLQRDHGYSVSVPIIDPETGASSTFDFELGRAMRSGGFPMCPNYWDAHGGDNPGPLNHASKDVNQDGEIYKFPNKVVGSPLVGDPELHFCRKWQEKYDATCCATYLDEDIQEEYEELVSTAPKTRSKRNARARIAAAEATAAVLALSPSSRCCSSSSCRCSSSCPSSSPPSASLPCPARA